MFFLDKMIQNGKKGIHPHKNSNPRNKRIERSHLLLRKSVEAQESARHCRGCFEKNSPPGLFFLRSLRIEPGADRPHLISRQKGSTKTKEQVT